MRKSEKMSLVGGYSQNKELTKVQKIPTPKRIKQKKVNVIKTKSFTNKVNVKFKIHGRK